MKNERISISLGGLPGLLGLIFIVLKLCKVIDWSWLWVLSPFWIGLALGLICVVIVAIWWRKMNK